MISTSFVIQSKLRNYARIHVFQKHCQVVEPSTRKILAKIYPFFEKYGLSKSFVIYSELRNSSKSYIFIGVRGRVWPIKIYDEKEFCNSRLRNSCSNHIFQKTDKFLLKFSSCSVRQPRNVFEKHGFSCSFVI